MRKLVSSSCDLFHSFSNRSKSFVTAIVGMTWYKVLFCDWIEPVFWSWIFVRKFSTVDSMFWPPIRSEYAIMSVSSFDTKLLICLSKHVQIFWLSLEAIFNSKNTYYTLSCISLDLHLKYFFYVFLIIQIKLVAQIYDLRKQWSVSSSPNS